MVDETRREFLKGMGLAATASILEPVEASSSSQQSSPASNWPQHQADAQNTGRNEQSKVPVKDHSEEWSFDQIQKTLSSPVVDEETDTAFIGSQEGKIYAVNLSDGFLNWSKNLNDYIEAAPAVIEDDLIVGRDRNGLVRLDKTKGDIKDEYRLQGGIEDITVSGHKIAVQESSSGSLHLLDKEFNRIFSREHDTGANPGSIAIDSGKGLLTYSTDGQDNIGKLRTVDLSSGSILSEFELPVNPNPEGVMEDGKYILNLEYPEESTMAVDVETGQKVWEYDHGRDDTSPVIADGMAILGDKHGDVIAVDVEDGSEVWKTSTEDGIYNSIAGQDTLAVSNNAGYVYFLDIEDGEVINSFQIDYEEDGENFWPMIVYDDGLIAGGENSSIKRITGDLRSGETNHPPEADYAFEPVNFPDDADIVEGMEVRFDGSISSDPDGDELSFEWDIDADGDYERSGDTTTMNLQNSGTYPVALKVTDGDLSDEVVKDIEVLENQVPEVKISENDPVPPGQTYLLGVEAEDRQGVSEIRVDIGDDGDYENIVEQDNLGMSITFNSPGEYPIGIEVEDELGKVTREVISADIEDVGPGDVTGNGKPATDPDGDGRYEDVNGDGKYDIVDVQALFAHRESEEVTDHPYAFDFNGDGNVDIVDVQKLFADQR